jgi:hypothetical protein
MNKLSKPLKIVIGIATIWPIIYMPIFFIFFFRMFILSTSSEMSGFPQEFMVIIPLHIFTVLSGMILYLVYILDLINTDRIDKDKKTLWGLLLIFLGMIAMPIYWYLFVWKTPQVSSKRTSGRKR